MTERWQFEYFAFTFTCEAVRLRLWGCEAMRLWMWGCEIEVVRLWGGHEAVRPWGPHHQGRHHTLPDQPRHPQSGRWSHAPSTTETHSTVYIRASVGRTVAQSHRRSGTVTQAKWHSHTGEVAQSHRQSGIVTQAKWHSHTGEVAQSHGRTVAQSHRRTVAQSHSRTVAQSHRRSGTVTQSPVNELAVACYFLLLQY